MIEMRSEPACTTASAGAADRLALRAATIGDAQLLMQWRNDPQTRANSHDRGAVKWDSHMHWLGKVLVDPSCDLLIAELDGVPVGTVRIDRGTDESTLSWTIAPEWRGRGFGRRMVRLASERVSGRPLRADIRQDNVASQAIARAAGFEMTETHGQMTEWHRERQETRGAPFAAPIEMPHARDDERVDDRYYAARLFLRPLLESDINERYAAWFADPSVTQFLESRNFSTEESKAYLRAGHETGRYFMYAVCLKQTGVHVGNVKIGPINRTHQIADLVTVIGDRSCWGQGLAAEAIALGSRVAFEMFGLRKLHGAILAANTGSLKAYTRGGWTVEGRLRDHYLVDGAPMDVILVSCFNDRPWPTPAAT